MKQLWAPWRMNYILGEKSQTCIFCHTASVKRSKKKLLLYSGNYSLVMLNKYPYTNCHLLVAPQKHTDSLSALSRKASQDLFSTLQKSVSLLKEAVMPEGFNIGMNLGRIAGAGIEDHLHFHIVPRWFGDTNALTVFGEVRVIPEHIKDTYSNLKPYFNKIDLNILN